MIKLPKFRLVSAIRENTIRGPKWTLDTNSNISGSFWKEVSSAYFVSPPNHTIRKRSSPLKPINIPPHSLSTISKRGPILPICLLISSYSLPNNLQGVLFLAFVENFGIILLYYSNLLYRFKISFCCWGRSWVNGMSRVDISARSAPRALLCMLYVVPIIIEGTSQQQSLYCYLCVLHPYIFTW